MSTIHAAARRVLAALRAHAVLGDGVNYATCPAPSVAERALVAHLASACPGLVQTIAIDGMPMHTASVIMPGGATISFQRVAPACYEPAHSFDPAAGYAAYVELERLAAEAPDLARARAAHVQHPAIPVDGVAA